MKTGEEVYNSISLQLAKIKVHNTIYNANILIGRKAKDNLLWFMRDRIEYGVVDKLGVYLMDTNLRFVEIETLFPEDDYRCEVLVMRKLTRPASQNAKETTKRLRLLEDKFRDMNIYIEN